jgi:chromosome segregation ATPase
MARAGILYSQVAKAAAKLAAAGKNPTVDSVREALGGTGSKSTIAPMLKTWKSEHQESAAQAQLGLPAELVHAVKSVYDNLQADVAQQLEAARKVHQQEQAALAERVNQAAADNRALTDANANLAQKLAQVEEAYDRLQHDQHKAVVALTAAQTENAGLQQRLADRAAEVTSLAQQLTHARTQFEHYQESTARQRAEERQAFEQRIARLEHDLAASQRQQAAQQVNIGQQETRLAHLGTDNERLQKEVDIAHNVLAAVRTERDQLGHQVQTLSAAHTEAKCRLEALEQALSESRIEAASALKQIEMLAQDRDRAEAKVEKADRERLQLMQTLLERQAQPAASSEISSQ